MLILLTNDDGIYAPGINALAEKMRLLGEVIIVAPATEQSGVGHSITYLTPLVVKEVFGKNHGKNHGQNHGQNHSSNQARVGWAVEGSPADCVKIGIHQFCPRPPDLVVSGINCGLNAGINVLYSGTVAAAIEGAFYGITSVAVSLEYDEHAPFDRAAAIASQVIQQLLANKGPESQLFNINIPTAALQGAPEVCTVPMNVTRYEDSFERRKDPWGRSYYWLKGGPPEVPTCHETDLSGLAKGKVTVTPLDFDLTKHSTLSTMENWKFQLDPLSSEVR